MPAVEPRILVQFSRLLDGMGQSCTIMWQLEAIMNLSGSYQTGSSDSLLKRGQIFHLLIRHLFYGDMDIVNVTCMTDFPLFSVLALGTLVYLSHRLSQSKHALSNLPTIGYSSPLLSYISGLRFLLHGGDMVQEGYEKYKGGIFKVAELFDWQVIVTGATLIEELRQAKEDQLSFDEAIVETISRPQCWTQFSK